MDRHAPLRIGPPRIFFDPRPVRLVALRESREIAACRSTPGKAAAHRDCRWWRAPRIAVVGGGISGLSTALALMGHARVTLFEAETRLGGHARTVIAGRRGDQPVDTGFIVFNHATYPHLGRLFRELDVPIQRSDMSFGASLDGGRIEYALRDTRALFARPGNALSPTFLRMLRDILRFNRAAEAAVTEDQTVGALIDALGLGEGFRRLYIRPFCGRSGRCPTPRSMRFPRPCWCGSSATTACSG